MGTVSEKIKSKVVCSYKKITSFKPNLKNIELSHTTLEQLTGLKNTYRICILQNSRKHKK